MEKTGIKETNVTQSEKQWTEIEEEPNKRPRDQETKRTKDQEMSKYLEERQCKKRGREQSGTQTPKLKQSHSRTLRLTKGPTSSEERTFRRRCECVCYWLGTMSTRREYHVRVPSWLIIVSVELNNNQKMKANRPEFTIDRQGSKSKVRRRHAHRPIHLW